MAGYSPAQPVVYMHDNVPRFDVSAGMARAPNTFGADFYGVDKPYYIGVLSVGGAYWAIGIVSFLIFSIVYVSYGMCRPQYRQPPKGNCCARAGKCLFSPRVWYIIAALAMLGGTGAALSLVTSFKNATNDTTRAMTTFSDVIHVANTETNDYVQPQLLASMSSSAAFSAAATGNGSTSDIINTINDIGFQTTAANFTVGMYEDSLNDMDKTLRKLTNSPDYDISQLGNKVFLTGVVLMAFFLGFVVVTLFGMIGTKGGACWHRAFNACGLVISTLVVFLLAGLISVVAILGSDVCVAPGSAILSVANATKAQPYTYATLNYYINCGITPGYPVQGAWEDITGVQSALIASLADYAYLQSALTPADTWATPFMTELNNSLVTANASMSVVASSVACSPLNSLYYDVLQALCNTGIVAAIKTWGLLTAACILIYVMTSAGARLCYTHAGDEMLPEDPAKAAAAAGVDPNAQRGAVVSINDHGNAVGAAPQLMYVPAAGYASGGNNLKAGSAATYA